METARAAAEIEIEDRQVDIFALEDLQRGVGELRLGHFVAFAAQELHDDRAHQLLVFDHQDAVGAALLAGPTGLITTTSGFILLAARPPLAAFL